MPEFHHAVKDASVWMAPDMELAVAQFNAQTLWVFRANGEIVWELEMGQGIKRVTWRPDSRVLFVWGTKGLCRVFDVVSGENVDEYEIETAVDFAHWCRKDNTLSFDTRQKYQDDHTDDEKILPVLNGVASGDLVKCKNTELDFILFNSFSKGLSLVFSNAFIVDSNILQGHNVQQIVSTPNLRHHFLIAEKDGLLELLQLELPFINGSVTRRLSSSYAKILDILRIIKKTSEDIQKVQAPFLEYTFKIMRLLKEERQSQEGAIDDLYDLLLTGNLSEETKKWLTDYIGDRGIKRWSKLGSTYFEFAKKSIFITLIPALTHLIVSSKKLKFKSNNLPHDFLQECYKFIIEINEFQSHFKQTMQWLECILKEIAGDEPQKVKFQVKDIVKFLLFGNSLTSDQGDDVTFINYYRKIQSEINGELESVKSSLRHQIRLTHKSSIGPSVDRIELSRHDGKIYILSQSGNTLMVKNGSVQTYTLQKPDLVTAKFKPSGDIVVVSRNLIEVYSLNFENRLRHIPIDFEISQFDLGGRSGVCLAKSGKFFEFVPI